MPELTPPSVAVRASFIAALEELRAAGQGGLGADSTAGRELREYGRHWHEPEGFARYLRVLRDEETEDHAGRAGRVPQTTLWWVSGDEYPGRADIRHRLTDRLRKWGGHIGYDIRPSARRQGHATAVLAAALPMASGLGIDPALLTCDQDNIGSRKVIEANGGVLADQQGGRLRYWVPTSSR
jgi:predicted acetyltransferase